MNLLGAAPRAGWGRLAAALSPSRGRFPRGKLPGRAAATPCDSPADSEQPPGFAKPCQGRAAGSREKLALSLLALPGLHQVPVARLGDGMPDGWKAGGTFQGSFPRAEPHSNIPQVAAVQAAGERVGLELTHTPETPFPNF